MLGRLLLRVALARWAVAAAGLRAAADGRAVGHWRGWAGAAALEAWWAAVSARAVRSPTVHV